MNKTAFLVFSPLPLALLAACGGNVATVGSGGSSTTTSTGTTTSGTTTSGTTTSGTTTSTGTTTSSSTTTSAGGCASFIDLAVDNGAPEHLTAICAAPSWNPGKSAAPIGYLLEGGPAPGLHDLHVLGCVSAAPNGEGIEIVVNQATGPGNYTAGSATYTDPMGGVWTTMSFSTFQVGITKLGAVGDTIEGTFSAWTGQVMKQQAHPVAGSFHVCHVGDEQVP